MKSWTPRLIYAAVAVATLALSGCVAYDPGPTYAYGPAPGYYYGPPVYGSIYLGGGWHEDHRHWH